MQLIALLKIKIEHNMLKHGVAEPPSTPSFKKILKFDSFLNIFPLKKLMKSDFFDYK
jgi:hypothetical protein